MRIPTHKTFLLVLAALAALVIAGCGGGGGGETSETTTTSEAAAPLSKAGLVSQGDAVCGEVNAAVGALSNEASEAAVQQTTEKVANLYVGMVQSLQRLGRPQGAEGAYSGFMEAAEELAKVESEVKLAAEREDTAALGEAASQAAPALEEFESRAAAYGFKQCGEEPNAPTTGGGVEPGGSSSEEPGSAEEGGVEPGYEEAAPEEAAPEEAAPETGGAGGGAEVAPEGGGGGETGGSSGGVGPG